MKDEESIILFPIPAEELWTKLRELVHAEMLSIKSKEASIAYQVPGLVRKPIYKANEICEMLNITRQTLHQWVKEGLLHCYKIKSRAFFLADEVEALIKNGVE